MKRQNTIEIIQELQEDPYQFNSSEEIHNIINHFEFGLSNKFGINF